MARRTALLCEPRVPARPWNAPYPTRPPPTRLHPLHAARATRALDLPFSRSRHGVSGTRTARRQQHPARDGGRGARARHSPPSRGGRHRRARGQSTRRGARCVRAASAAPLCGVCQRRSCLTRCASVPRDREEASRAPWRAGSCNSRLTATAAGKSGQWGFSASRHAFTKRAQVLGHGQK